jgi:hypothetical protein
VEAPAAPLAPELRAPRLEELMQQARPTLPRPEFILAGFDILNSDIRRAMLPG